jgi:hypothetical protein
MNRLVHENRDKNIGNVIIKTSGRPDVAPLTYACTACLIKKTKSTPARLAPLRFAPARGAWLRSRMRRSPASPTRCGAWLPSPDFGAQLPASRSGAVADPARRATNCESQRSATSPAKRGARALPPCPVSQPPSSHCLQAPCGPLPPANSTRRRVSILQAARTCLC